MKHLILGAGNLGKDLLIELNLQRADSVKLMSASNGLDCSNIDEILKAVGKEQPDVVWYCVGGGSVAEAKSMNQKVAANCANLNFSVPLNLVSRLHKDIRLVVFSTDYVADESRPDKTYLHTPKPLSHYAEQKLFMEKLIKETERPFTTIVRVGSLYGTHKPEKTFPGKIIENYGFNSEVVNCPSNIVVPTPTRWIAAIMARSLTKVNDETGVRIEHLAPTGGVSLMDWAKFVLKGIRSPEAFQKADAWFDYERPLFSGLKNSVEPELKTHWHELWKIYFQPEWFTQKPLREFLPEEAKYDPSLNQPDIEECP